jgi:hypothetical protein
LTRIILPLREWIVYSKSSHRSSKNTLNKRIPGKTADLK